jgi:lipoic acid synthetase/lipoate-protein ligase A
MIHIALQDNSQKRLVWYLAMEEYVARHLKELTPGQKDGAREAFFLWQVPPTVIFGRNQVMEAEVNIRYCRSHGVQLYRRKSGGGCVYSDEGNIMLSFITDSTDVAFTFDSFLQRLALYLRRLGLDASRSGRNDVMVGGRKVSGNSFFLQPTTSIVHGTLLFDTDFSEMEKAITPSDEKIQSKGVSSVHQHVLNLKGELEKSENPKVRELTDIVKFKKYLIRSFCTEGGELKETVLGKEHEAEIDAIEATYLDPDFLHGRNHRFSITRQGKIDNVGEIEVELQMNEGKISGIHVGGDFFATGPVDDVLSRKLKGISDSREEAEKALEGVNLGDLVMNLGNEDFLDLAFGKKISDKTHNQ